MNLQLHTGEQIKLANKAFASGGEGDLYHILSPKSHRKSVVKYYKSNYQTTLRARKIDYLIQHRPNLQSYKGHHSLIWAEQKIVDKTGKFVGFLMPIAEGISLEKLCHPKLPKTLPKVWQKFDFQKKNALQLRLRICFNIAAALYQIHQTQRYVLVDMKPENILIKPNGLISIIDVDSVEIVEKGRVLFSAPVATPDYTPPEYTNTSQKNKPKTSEGDTFSLAVIFYRLLMGIHPFTGTCRKPYDHLETLAEMIEHGLYPHSPKWQNCFEVVPPPHQKFHQLPPPVKKLFLQCFEIGFTQPQLRPSADDWCKALANMQSKSAIAKAQKQKIKIPLPEWTPSKALVLPPPIFASSNINIQQLQSLQLASKRLNYKDQMLRQRMVRNYQQQIQYLKGMSHKLQQEQKELHKITKAFEQKQTLILKDEQKQFDQMLQPFEKKLLQIEKKGQQLAGKEETERQKNHNQSVKKSTELLQQIQVQQLITLALRHRDSSQLQQQLRKMREYTHKQKQVLHSDLQQSILLLKSDFQQQKRKQLKLVDEQLNKKLKQFQKKHHKIEVEQKEAFEIAAHTQLNPLTRQWLKSHRIKDHVSRMFSGKYAKNSVIVNQLSRFGINTAADFAKANSNGKLLKTNGKWVKVPKVGLKRAKKLEEWRSKLLRQTPLSRLFPSSVSTSPQTQKQFAPKFLIIENQVRQARKQSQQKRANTLATFERKEQTLEGKTKRLQQKTEREQQQLQQKTDKEIQAIKDQFLQLAKTHATQPQKVFQQLQQKIEKLQQNRSKTQESNRKKQQEIAQKYQRLRQNHQLLEVKNLGHFSERDLQQLKQKTRQRLQQNLQQHYSQLEYAKSHIQQLEESVQRKLLEVRNLKRRLEA